jgi:hypothetical protein
LIRHTGHPPSRSSAPCFTCGLWPFLDAENSGTIRRGFLAERLCRAPFAAAVAPAESTQSADASAAAVGGIERGIGPAEPQWNKRVQKNQKEHWQPTIEQCLISSGPGPQRLAGESSAVEGPTDMDRCRITVVHTR